MTQLAAHGAFAGLLTSVLLLLLVPLLRRRGVIDHPGPRSSHKKPVVRGGGLACAVAFMVSAIATTAPGSQVALVAIALFAGVGLLDDLRSLSAGRRLLAQAGIAALLVGAVAATLGAQEPILLWAPISTVFIVAMVNAFNFMDGINGISALTAIVAGVYYTTVGAAVDSDTLLAIGTGVAGSAAGFLPWNFPRAKVFLGDVGSYLYGAALGTMALMTFIVSGNLLLAIAPLVIYLADTARTLALRAKRRERLLAPHRTHVYQLTSDLIGQPAMASIAAGFSAVNAVAALAWAMEPTRWLTITVMVGTAMAYCLLPNLVRRRVRIAGP